MYSTVVIITAVTAIIGFFLNSTILFFVVKHKKKRYHLIFSAILGICAIWDLGVFLMMIRNPHESEQILYGYLVSLPCIFLPVLIFQFACEYVHICRPKTILLLWVYCMVSATLLVTGLYGRIDGVNRFSWGVIYRPDAIYTRNALTFIPFYYFATLSACWFLYKARQRARLTIQRRHLAYLFAAFIALSIAIVKVVVVIGIDLPYLLPAGMLLNDLFVALIGIAIIKERLFDITVIIKKAALYSMLAGLIILVFSVSEHLLTTYLVHQIGSHSTITHILSLVFVIAILLPIKQRIEHGIDRYFTQKKLELDF